jgi:hypothetical protein
MNTHHLQRFLANQPGSLGQRMSWSMAVNMIMAGQPVAAGALVDLIGLDVIPALVEAGAPAPALRAAIDAGALVRYRELPGLIARNGGRAVFADWCRQAGYTAPETLPQTVDLYRGTLGCSAAQAATGLHWTTRFDSAAAFAAWYADDDLTGVIVLHTRVPRTEIACFISTSVHDEMIPADVPAMFDVITDKDRIKAGVVREAARQEQLQARYVLPKGHGTAERVAMEARARMAAAGVPRGAALIDVKTQ